MPIAFDQVGFTYNDLKQLEKQQAREKKLEEKRKKKRAKASLRKQNGRADSSQNNAAQSAQTASPSAQANKLWALHNINFTLEDGEFLGIAGHTGSGKSTLVQHMNGLVHPTRGTVAVNGLNLADKKSAQKARSLVGIVFQYPEHQLFAATVFDDVAFGPRNMGLDDKEVDERVRHALECVQLNFDELREKSPFELSGGQQRRVAFAGVLAMKPRMLVLDEPVAGLDPQAREEFLQLIEKLHKQGLTVVMVSHNMDDLARLSDRILVLKDGEQFALGTPAEVFAHADELRAIGLGVPDAQNLANELRKEGFDLPQALYDTESLANDLARLYHTRMTQAKQETPPQGTQAESEKDHAR